MSVSLSRSLFYFCCHSQSPCFHSDHYINTFKPVKDNNIPYKLLFFSNSKYALAACCDAGA